MTQSTSIPAQEMTLAQAVEHLTQFDGPPREFLLQLLSVQCQLASADGGAVLRRSTKDKDKIEPLVVYPPPDVDQTPPLWLAQAVEIAPKSLQSAHTTVVPVARTDDLYDRTPAAHLILLPLRRVTDAGAVAAFVVSQADQRILARSQERLELTVSLLSLYEMRLTLQHYREDLRGLSTVSEVLAATNEHARFKAMTMALCNEVATRWRAERVSLGLLVGRYVKLRAMSQTENITRKMKLVQDLESAMEESLDQDVEVLYPTPPEATVVSRAARELAARHGPASICSLPLRRGSEAAGVLTIERPADEPLDAAEVELLRLMCDMCTARVLELHERDRWFGARAAASARAVLAGAVGPQHTWAKVTAIGLLALILFLVFAKGQYRVEAPFVLEAIEQQVIPAPFSGYLNAVNVEPGDLVETRQTVLATLDTAELQLDLSRLQSVHYGFEKEALLAAKERKWVEVQIAEFQAEETDFQIQWIQHQLRLAQIKSPISGTVVEGDLKRRVGAPVEKGDPLFQVAPLEALRAVLHVPDHRIADIHEGQEGELAAASHPGDYLPFVVEHINPKAEVINNANVFRVRVRLLEKPRWMLPGIEGVAKAKVDRRPYAWIWTRDAISWVRMKLWI